MKYVILILMVIMMISTMLIMLNLLLSIRQLFSMEKLTPFECGFEPLNSARTFFSMRFYMIAIIFLIFDIELTLIIPIPNSLSLNETFNLMFIMMFFISLLIFGILHEWKHGSLNWTS